MALNDILFTEGEEIGFIQTQNRGNIGTVSSIFTEPSSNSGQVETFVKPKESSSVFVF